MSNKQPYNTAHIQAEQVFCSNCGKKLREGASYCTECGSVVGYTQQLPIGMPVQPHPPRKKYGTRIAGATMLSFGFTLLITAGILFFMSWGYLDIQSVITASVGGGLMFLGMIVMLIPVKKI